MLSLISHGGSEGVTGSCHELVYAPGKSFLVDCGLFQGAEQSSHGDTANAKVLNIDFDLSQVQALLVTHAHIDHIGRIPYLLMAGFTGPIICTDATAKLLPLMLEDAVRLGVTQDRRLITLLIDKIKSLMVPLPFGVWHRLDEQVKLKFKRAGHILGSAYIEVDLAQPQPYQQGGQIGQVKRVIFSGDLGAPYSPLLPNLKPAYACDLLVLESTYGNRLHQGRRFRTQALKAVIEHCVRDRGVVLIPAFSLGRTQALLYEFEQIIHQHGGDWENIEVLVDSPMANEVTRIYRELKPLWDAEAQRKLAQGRHPLAFEQLTTISDTQSHQQVVEYLQRTARPTIVIAASGMCTGGRIVAYLKALLGDPRTDIIFCGYQSPGTNGWAIQRYGNKQRYPQGYVELDGQRYPINAQVHHLSGYSAHADQQDLINFVKRMRRPPKFVRLVHGDTQAKSVLANKLRETLPGLQVGYDGDFL
ncbi:MBL fold metallo-hydrolase RNA specificity domain-containing protein [Nitrincola tapanii]|uniref:MBL fold metallo-hydrolase n=1 Tax=Nitrincola tapanii TaxID=1708751 RepID=A0A5A9W522_9GAMM|nr:MBL fold metallo-hydrolase [Nitrincola tapanii]KAA0875752.1 MBL fold metallo-hydrolase [Nitrincola tapanii]